MQNTGERYLPEFDGDWTLEHTHRYYLACEFAKNKRVLDIACGDGYGSRMLADVAESVIGVDISLETVVRAVGKYPHPRLSFMQGSVTAIPLANSSVDLVVSFETIEHLSEHEEILREIRRVLHPDGLLIMSSPDKYEYSDIPNYTNEFHVKELYRDEFEVLLKTQFKNIRVIGQRVVFGSIMGAEENSPFFTWRKGEQSRAQGLSQAEYFIALAGDGIVPLLPSSILKTPVEQSNRVRDLKEKHEKISDHLTNSLDRIQWYEGWEKEARSYISVLEAKNTELEAKREAEKTEFEAQQRQDQELEERLQWYEGWEKEARGYIADLEAEREELHKLYASRSWKITAPLRATASLLRRILGREATSAPDTDFTSVSFSAGTSQPMDPSVSVWPPDVRALEKPLALKDGVLSEVPSLGVFLHIYYEDIIGEMLDCLRNIPETAQIHISTDTEAKQKSIVARFEKEGWGSRTEIRVCPNVGWDIAPFIVGFADRIPQYSLLLRLHSKRSTQYSRSIGESWRKMLFTSLAGTPDRVKTILQAFEHDPGLGMVCPPIASHYAGSVNFGSNLPLMKFLLRQYDIDILPDTELDFPMGSMFWCRPQVLTPWLDKHFYYEDFTPTIKKERDGSLAHALERLFFFGCGISGYSWSRLQNPIHQDS